MGERRSIDWEAVEPEYRAGIRSLRHIAAQFGCTEGAIRSKAKERGWERDLSARIAAKTEALLRKEELRKEVRNASSASDAQIVESNARMLADTVLNQRTDVKRAMGVVTSLWSQIEVEGDYTEEFRRVGEMMRKENSFGEDKLNDMYLAAIDLPQRVKNAKLLADALRVLVELQRKVLRIDDKPNTTGDDDLPKLTDAQRASRIANLLARAVL
jgi:hypothetical protein